MNNLIVKDFSFSYQRNKEILDNINFKLESNKIYVLLGENGAGKTTLFNCISSLLKSDKGSIETKGDIIHILDNPKFQDYLKVSEYIKFLKLISKNKINSKIDKYIKEFKLDKVGNNLIKELSLGQKHKLALAVSISINYDVFLIDEPLTSLDISSQKYMINFLKNFKKEDKLILVSTHMLHIAYDLSDEFLVLSDGKITQMKNDFESYELFENYVCKQMGLIFN